MIDKKMHLSEALRLAMEKEKAAHDFYSGAINVVESPDVVALFKYLAAEETKHRQLLEDEYDKVVRPDN